MTDHTHFEVLDDARSEDAQEIGHPDDPLTKRAAVDAVLLAQSFHRDDDPAVQAILNNCDPYSVALQLCGFLYATLRHCGADVEERLGIWLAATRQQLGEGN